MKKHQTAKKAVLMLVSGGLAVLVIIGGWREFERWNGLRRDIAAADVEIEKTRANIAELQKKLALVRDPEYLEKEARENLNVRHADEEVFVVVGLDEVKQEENFSLSPSAIQTVHPVLENVKAWWRYYFE